MTRLSLTVSLLFLLLCVPGLVAQEQAAKPTPRKLALEIVGRHYGSSPVLEPPSEGGFMEMSAPRQLPEWKPPAGAVPLTRIRIRSKYEGAGVRINVAVVFDDSEPADAPGPKYGEKEQALASYLAQEGETVTVSELARFGVEPLRLRVVEAAPRESTPPPALQPQLSNPLKSVTVVSFESEAHSPTSYRLTLRNLAPKSIIVLDVYSAQSGGRSSERMQGTPARPLMAPGATFEAHVSINGGGGRMTPQGFLPDPPRQQTLVVGTVIFEDGTYEGEVRIAAEFTAERRGLQTQLARVLPLLPCGLDAPEQDAAPALEKLKAQISTLRIDVDPGVVDELRARFPELSKEEDRAQLAVQVMSGLKQGRAEALHILSEVEALRVRNPEGLNLRQLLCAAKEQLERRSGNR